MRCVMSAITDPGRQRLDEEPLSDEELRQTEIKEDACWRIAFLLGCAVLLGAAWLS